MTISVDTGVSVQNEAPVRTTDATSTELLRWTPELDSASVVLLSVNGTATSGDRLASQHLYQVKRDLSGTTITAMAAEARHESGSGAWTVTLAVDGADGISAVCSVVGEAAHDVTWQGLATHKVRGLSIIPWGDDYSLEFNGSDEHIEIGNICNVTELATTPLFTWSVWFKTSAAAEQVFVCKQADATSPGWRIGITAAGKLFMFEYRNGTNYREFATVVAGLNDGAWHHFTVTSSMRFIVDGTWRATTSSTMGGGDATNALDLIFGSFNGGGDWFDGLLDEMCLYSERLSDAEAAWLYNSGKPRDPRGSGAPANLASYWRLGDFDSGTTALDSVGANDGMLVSMTIAANRSTDVP